MGTGRNIDLARPTRFHVEVKHRITSRTYARGVGPVTGGEGSQVVPVGRENPGGRGEREGIPRKSSWPGIRSMAIHTT